ncbi:putative multidrug resistance protein 1 (ATP-binding cassette C1) [Schistosoma mansoni]|uniref:putative multidrug resistance protein 1 (ATP-binding cassette C1) n=1 Tax=Schistosoma mansoni TaxID=6183 RepID=UPI0001A63B65|nr:putative multidrug resistance protein 1 (ATP-binding cassette C1) [Schistosoma mansoni]|eukprot:XP_018655393.1 putative multidrug resistance protein 1 (ATP-binding cassette C1) [Schistosoma mansoni]
MVEYKRRACQPRSQMLFAFTCLIIVCMLPRLYGLLYAGRGWYNQSTFYWLHAATISVYICLAFGELLIQFFSPFNEQNSLLDDKDACPELWASVPALWTFNWLTSTIWKGFRGQINSPSDMFHIRPEDSVNKSYGRFKRAWNRSYNLWFKRKEPETPFSNVMDDDVPLLMDFKENNEDTENVSNDANMLNATPDVDILSPSTTNNNSNSYNLEVCKQSTIKASPARATWGLFYALISSFGLRLFCGWIFISAAVFFNYSSPLLLGMLLRFLSKPEAPLWQGYFIAFSMLFLQSISVLVDQKGFYSCLSLGISVRSALTSAIYRKSLRLSSEARSQYTTGELINLLSVDVNRIKELFMFSFLVWDAFIEFGLSFILLWRQLGSAAIAGVGFLLLVLPLNCLLIWATQKFEIREMKYKDKRMKCLGEVLAAIRVVKLYAWEKAFQSQVKSIRQSELTELLRVALGWGLCHVVWNLAPYIILLITFVTYLREFLFANHNVLLDNWVGNTTDIPTPQLLTPERIFVSVSLFNLLRSPLLLLPWSLSSSIMAFVSIRRLGLFLLADELEHYSSDKIYPLDENAIIFENASFSWTKTGPLALQKDSFCPTYRSLTLMPNDNDFQPTINRSDIYLLDDPLSAVDTHVGKYLFDHVLGPNGLLKDKTRIMTTNSFHWLSLADWIIVLNTNGEITQSGTYNEVVNNNSGHFTNYLESIEKNKINDETSNQRKISFTTPFNRSSSVVVVMATDGALNDLIDFRSEQEVTHRRSAASISTTDLNASTSDNDKLENDDVECGKFMTDEEIMHGHVSWSTYWEYFRARSVSVTFISVLSYAGFLAFQNTTIISNETARQILIEQIKDRILYYIIGYAWAGLGQTVLILLFALLNAYSNLRASNLLHQHLLSKILHAPASFFDHTPLGRILNRFSNDVDNLDHTIPNSFSDTIGTTGDVLISLMIVTVTLRPFGIGLAVIIPVFIFCITVLVFYMPSVRQTRRLDANTRSPLLTNYSETSASSLGVTVVRAFKRDKEFIAKSDKLIDANAVFEYVRFVANRWLDVHLNLSCSFMVFVCAIILVAFRSKISPGIAGLIIVYALQVFDSLTWVIKQLSQLETSSVSLERICEYIRVEQEADWDHGVDSPPPIDWPRPCCEITFNKATVQYHLPTKNKVTDNHDLSVSQKTSSNSGRLVTALKSIDLKLSGNPQERRIGIVGRTGAGKSSLASSIFRLIEPTILEEDRLDTHRTSTKRGPIVVDGVDLSRIGLHELRSRFSILPQEPIIFAGTLRFNLDPFGKLPDIDLWRAIESAHLADWVRSTNAGLDYECGEGGANLSAGQRQLVCLARVFLSSGGRVRLLILDEATAAMDPSTDNLVMNTVIGDIFKDATVIIIAHRLSTVMNTDRIVVLDHGQVIETGHPQDLLNNPNSHFSIMNKVKQS